MAVEHYGNQASKRDAAVSPFAIDRSDPVPTYIINSAENSAEGAPEAELSNDRIIGVKRWTNIAISIVIGVALILVGLFISFFFGIATVVGFLFGIPIILVGIAIPLLMMGVSPEAKDIRSRCPHCGKMIVVPKHLRQTECLECDAVIQVENGRFTLPQGPEG